MPTPPPPRRERASEQIDRIQPLHGGDRSGLGAEGWAEVSDDLIGGHPELEDTSSSGPDGALNGPQPRMDRLTGAAEDESLETSAR